MAEAVARLDRDSALTFPIALADGRMIASIGEAADLLHALSETERTSNHWLIAIRMLDNAIREPSYLKTATLSLQTALAMDGRLDHLNAAPAAVTE
jgi:hypothetical protein